MGQEASARSPQRGSGWGIGRLACHVAGAITPVPGGIGPVTNLMLVQNTIKAARRMLHEWS